jgi:hypothetical protein
MRLLKIGVYYPDYLAQFYAERPGLAARGYEPQHTALMADCFGSSDFWTRALSAFGYETCDLVINAAPMQRAWAAERGLRFDEVDWMFSIAEAQVRDFSPDVLLVADYTTITAVFIRHLRERCPTLRLVIGWCGAPYRDGSVFGACDLVLSCVPELVAHFRAEGHRSRHVNHAFEPRVLEKIGDDDSAPPLDFLFIGSVVKADDFHLEREAILTKLIEETGLEIFSNACAPSDSDESRSAGTALQRRGGVSQLLSLPFVGAAARGAARLLRRPAEVECISAAPPGVDERIRRRARPPLFGMKMFRQLSAGRVALNTHIDVSPVSASNMRLFEATGVGTCLLTDWKANLSELFEPDAEVVTYRDAEECIEKVRYLLGHESERRSIAAAGQRRTLRDHTFADRAARIDAFVREALSSG